MTKNSHHKPLFDLASNAIFARNSSSVHSGKGRPAPARGLDASVVSASQGAPDARKVTAPLWSRHFERTSRSAFECRSLANLKALRKGTSAFDALAACVDLAQSTSVTGAADYLSLARRRQLQLQ